MRTAFGIFGEALILFGLPLFVICVYLFAIYGGIKLIF